MVLSDGVNALTCEKAPFDDVAANRWSAPCIAWNVLKAAGTETQPGVPEVLPTIPETPADEKPGNDNDNGDILLPEVP